MKPKFSRPKEFNRHINPIQPSLFEKWFSNFFDALKDHLQMQLKPSILF